MKRSKMFISLALIVIIAVSMSVGAFAASNLTEIKAYLNAGLNINLNGEDWTPKDAEGKVIIPITYNSTTYLPARAIGEALGVKVGWDGSTNTVLLGEASVTVPKTPITTDGEYTAGDFTIYDVTAESGNYGWDVAAEVRNDGAELIQAASLTIIFYGEDGKRIGTATGTVLEIGKDEVKTVTFVTLDDLTGYKTMKAQVDYSL
jgi:hypothetical protein